MAEQTKAQEQEQPRSQKKKAGGYDHQDHHTAIYSANGVKATNSPIDKAWARLHDRGHYAGPAVGTPFMLDENTEAQHFQYAHATHDVRPSNKNRKVQFHFGPAVTLEESGLESDDELE